MTRSGRRTCSSTASHSTRWNTASGNGSRSASAATSTPGIGNRSRLTYPSTVRPAPPMYRFHRPSGKSDGSPGFMTNGAGGSSQRRSRYFQWFELRRWYSCWSERVSMPSGPCRAGVGRDTEDAFPEYRRLGEQAQNQKGFGFEIVKIAWLREHILMFKQPESPFLLRSNAGHMQRRIPAALDIEQPGAGCAHRLSNKRQVVRHASAYLLRDGVAHPEQARQGRLHRRAHRKIRVRNQLQPAPGIAHSALRTAHHDPGQLHLRQPRCFGKPAERKCQRLMSSDERAHAL